MLQCTKSKSYRQQRFRNQKGRPMIPTLDPFAAKLFGTFIRSVEKHMANCEMPTRLTGPSASSFRVLDCRQSSQIVFTILFFDKCVPQSANAVSPWCAQSLVTLPLPPFFHQPQQQNAPLPRRKRGRARARFCCQKWPMVFHSSSTADERQRWAKREIDNIEHHHHHSNNTSCS